MTTDLEERRHRLGLARHRFWTTGGGAGGPAPDALAEELPADLANSWRRCGRVVRPETVAPVELDDPAGAWSASCIRRAGGDPLDELAALARREDYLAAVTDERGRILWSSAGPSMLRAAERANFVRGANWSEASAGTNAPGLVLRTGRPAAVFATEHWCDTVTDWVCYAAPIRDGSGRVVGAVDLSADWRRAHPLALTTVSSIARLIGLRIAADRVGSGAEVQVAVLGEPRVTVAGAPVACTGRQLEILTILALHPDGLGLAELHERLVGERPVAPATVKAEVSRLRSVLGSEIASRPYRLRGAADLDVSTALDALGRGDLETALGCYRGPLLPWSESPHLRQIGHHIDVALGDGLLAWGTPLQLLRFADRVGYGLPYLERALAREPTGTPLHHELRARL